MGCGAYTHPPMNSYNVKIFNFMNTHPSNISKVSLCHYTYTLEGSWGGWVMVEGSRVGGCVVVGCMVGRVMGWVVEGFMGWVVMEWVVEGSLGGWVGMCWSGLLEGS